MRTLYVQIPEAELARLAELARREYRDPRAQAAHLIVEGLRRALREPARSGLGAGGGRIADRDRRP